MVECDFHEHYGIELSPDLLTERTGRWLRVRILGLLSIESRLRAVVFPPQEGGSQ